METLKTYLLVINDAPYGNERSYNALRLALNLVKREGVQVKVYLMADGVFCARQGQKTPDGYYNIERMIKSVAKSPPEGPVLKPEVSGKTIWLKG